MELHQINGDDVVLGNSTGSNTNTQGRVTRLGDIRNTAHDMDGHGIGRVRSRIR